MGMAVWARCEHCSIQVWVSGDFPPYCPHCGGNLELVPEATKSDEAQKVSSKKGCLRAILGLLWQTISHGTNFSGLILILAAAFLILGLGPLARFLRSLLMAVVAILADWLYRRWRGTDMLDFERGPRLLFFPLWIWGIIWFIVGMIQAIGRLIAG
jgi:hypothetical protein